MVKFLFLRKCPLVLLGLGLLGLAGCEKAENPAETPSSAPAASPRPQSAIPNSFDEVTAQLDAGGEFYLYLSTEQWLGKLSQGIDTLHGAMVSGSDVQGQQAGQGLALLKDAVQKSGLEEITGVGASSFAVSPGLYRNKVFVHHYPGKDTGILWSLGGKEPHALGGLDLLPPDTAAASFGDFDLPLLVNFLRQEASQSGVPEAQQAVAQWQTQFAGITGLQLDDVLNSLSGSMGMLLTLDATSTISIPLPNQPQTIPTPRLAILIGVKNDLIFKRIDKMLSSNPMVLKVDEPDLQMRTMPVPAISGVNLRPSVAQWNGLLVLASDDQVVRDMIAVQKGGPGYKSTPEFATLSAGLPQQGNSFGLTTQRFVDTMRKFQSQMLASQPGATASQAAMMQQIFANEYKGAGHAYAVCTHLPNGCLYVSQGSQGSSQLLAPLVMIPAAVLAPSFYLFRNMHATRTP